MQAGKGIQNESGNQNHQARRPGCEASGTREEGGIACVQETGSCLASATGENNRGMGQDPPPKSERRVGICSIVKSGGLIMMNTRNAFANFSGGFERGENPGT